MSTTTKRINNYFKTAIKTDVDEVKNNISLTDRQYQIFDMFYLKGQNIDFIADTIGVCSMVVNNELKIIRQKIIKIIGI